MTWTPTLRPDGTRIPRKLKKRIRFGWTDRFGVQRIILGQWLVVWSRPPPLPSDVTERLAEAERRLAEAGYRVADVSGVAP